MASTQTISEFNGTNAATETPSVTSMNLKRVDDATTTAYTASPINSTNNENSMSKYQALKFAGTWNSISAVTVKIDNNGTTGLSITGSVIVAAAGTTPTTTATGDAAMSTSGLTVLLGTSVTPYVTPGVASSTASGNLYTQALRLQAQTTSAYAGGPGDMTAKTVTWQWTES